MDPQEARIKAVMSHVKHRVKAMKLQEHQMTTCKITEAYDLLFSLQRQSVRSTKSATSTAVHGVTVV